MALISEYEGDLEHEFQIPQQNEHQKALVEETEEFVSSPYPWVVVSYDILPLLEEN